MHTDSTDGSLPSPRSAVPGGADIAVTALAPPAPRRPAVNELLAQPIDDEYLDAMTQRLAAPPAERGAGLRKLLVFRLGPEWFALAGECFVEAVDGARVHSLPSGRPGSVVIGVVNIRGTVEICVTLQPLLYPGGAGPASHPLQPGHIHRLLVIDPGEMRVAFPVDEVGGVHPCEEDAVQSPPPAAGGESLVEGLWTWRRTVVRVLERDTLYKALMHAVAVT